MFQSEYRLPISLSYLISTTKDFYRVKEKISRRTWLKGMAACSAAAGMPLSVGSPRAKAPTFEILPPIEKDLVADFGGSLPAWNAYLAANNGPLTLTIPAGTYGNFATGDYLASGAKANTTIVGAGAASTHMQIARLFNAGSNATPSADGPKWPSFATAHKGDTQITLTDFAACRTGKYGFNRFTGSGQWCCLMCFDMMGWGYPQNNYYVEFNKIVDLNETTGVVQLAYPLRHDYIDHYPTWSVGDWFHPDEGGRPTIMTYSQNGGWWNEITVKNHQHPKRLQSHIFRRVAERGV